MLPSFQINSFKIVFRTIYVISTTGLAILFPYFNQVLGVLGALSFWPLAIYFPVEMYFVQKKIEAWSRRWIVLRCFSFVCFLVTMVGLIGSLEGIVSEKLGWMRFIIMLWTRIEVKYFRCLYQVFYNKNITCVMFMRKLVTNSKKRNNPKNEKEGRIYGLVW